MEKHTLRGKLESKTEGKFLKRGITQNSKTKIKRNFKRKTKEKLWSKKQNKMFRDKESKVTVYKNIVKKSWMKTKGKGKGKDTTRRNSLNNNSKRN